MISENARNYENVVIRNEQEVGINNFGLDYMVGLEDEIERLKNQLQQKENIIKEVREYINHYETIRGYFEYEELGYDEYNYDEDLKQELLEILDKVDKENI